MRKQISPGAAAVVIAVVVAMLGMFLYSRSNSSGGAIKPTDMMKSQKARDAIGKAFRDQQAGKSNE